MRLIDTLTYAFDSLRRRQIRSWLTILGIIVGITAIVLLVGLVQGLKDDIQSQLTGFGSKTIMVVPMNVENVAGASSFMPTSGKLFMKDVERLKKIPDIDVMTPVIVGRTYIEYKGEQATTSVTGVDPEIYLQTSGTVSVEKGRFLNSADRRVAVLGSNIANSSFDKKIDISSIIDIGSYKYRVVGILNKSGNSFTNLDSMILIPFDEAKNMFNNTLADKEVTAIRISVREGVDPEIVSARVEEEMLMAHRVTEDKKDFGVITSKFINDQLNQVTGILSIFLGSIAGVSLLVGGIGISNTMFMSVTERRREIGVIKSIGARKSDILELFLSESILIGVVGGTLGLLAAFVLGSIISAVAGIRISFIPEVILGAIFFSGLVGVI